MTKVLALLCLLGGMQFSQTVLADDAMIKVDGSSTVFPITEAMAEEFQI